MDEHRRLILDQFSQQAVPFSGLSDVRRKFYKYPIKVEELLSRSFPGPGGADAFRQTVQADVGVNSIGIDAVSEGGLGFAFPVVIMSGALGK